MAYNQESIITDQSLNPIPQQFNPFIGTSGGYEPLQGIGSSMSVQNAMWYLVGSGATTTTIPLLTQQGVPLLLTSARQSQMVGGIVRVQVNNEICEAVITRVSASGTITLDSALPSAPAQGAPVMVTFPNQMIVTNSTIALPTDVQYNTLSQLVTMQNAATSTGTGIPLPTSGYGIAMIEITGTFNATIEFDVQGPAGVWYPRMAKQVGTGTFSTTTTSPGLYIVDVRGCQAARANITSYTSGKVTAVGVAQPMAATDDFVSLTGSNTQQVTLANAVTSTGTLAPQSVGGFKTLTFEVYGTATSFTLQIQGIGQSGTRYPLTVVNLSGLTTTQSISSAGLYKIDVTGLVSVQVNITSVSGGNVTVAGKLVA